MMKITNQNLIIGENISNLNRILGGNMAKCSKEIEELCLCRDCAVANCERYNCNECNDTMIEKIHEVFCCNQFREMDCSK